MYSLGDIKNPFSLPLIFKSEEKRNATKGLLIKDGIYPPIHWDLQNMIPKNYLYEHELNKKILSIPIDQRYDDEDMLRAVNILNGGAL